jgi:hypothetical protein
MVVRCHAIHVLCNAVPYMYCAMLCCSDGLDYPFLAKPKDDLRKDYRLMDFAGTTNALLARTPGTSAATFVPCSSS